MHSTFMNWSSGKDAALALYLLQQDPQFDVSRLFTSVNAHHNRVSMHGLRRSLLARQIQEIGLPLTTLELPEQPTMEEYELKMNEALTPLIKEGYTHAAFGDIFLEDLKKYREDQLTKIGLKGSFPLWKQPTKNLIHQFWDLGFRAIVITINGQLMDESFVGREIDADFIRDLPSNVDPCGENGEFHTFCFDGPIFNNPIPFTIGEKVFREYNAPKQDEIHENDQEMGFWFCDLIPDE